MSVRFLSVSAGLWLAACGISDSAVFGPGPSPAASDGGSAKGGAVGASGGPGASGATSGGVSGAGAGGRAGAPAGGAVTQPMAGGGNPPDPVGVAGDDAGGAGGEPTTPPQPVCGNGKLETGEECDGGAGDHTGCDDECHVVCADYGRDVLKSDDHHCYAGYDEAEFDAAKQDCVNRGAHLVTIASAAENTLVARFVNDTKFIGGWEDVPLMMEGTGNYRWITAEPFSFTKWDEGEPDRAESRCGGGGGPGPGPSAMRCFEHCVAIQGDSSWIDQRCDRVDGYVCEWEPPGSK